VRNNVAPDLARLGLWILLLRTLCSAYNNLTNRINFAINDYQYAVFVPA